MQPKGGADRSSCGLALAAGGEAALDRAAALLRLEKDSAALGTALPGPALHPETPPAGLAALGRSGADIDDVLVAALAAPADVTAHAVPLDARLYLSRGASLWGARSATPVGAPKAPAQGGRRTWLVRPSVSALSRRSEPRAADSGAAPVDGWGAFRPPASLGLHSSGRETGVPQLIALLAHIPRKNPCSERFRLVRNASIHRYTFLREVLASDAVM
jgi:hypothetical protein